MTAPASPPDPTPVGAREAAVSRHTLIVVTSVGGGLLAASLFLAGALPPGGPMLAVVVMGFAGAVALFVGAVLGAVSTQFSTGARAGFGVGAVLAFLMLLLVLFVGPAAAMQSSPVCGAIAAGPGLLALRSFTLLRDAGLP